MTKIRFCRFRVEMRIYHYSANKNFLTASFRITNPKYLINNVVENQSCIGNLGLTGKY